MDPTLPDASSDDPLPAEDSEGGCTLTITLDDDLADQPDTDWLSDRLAAVVDQLDLADCTLSVAIIADATMARMHEQFAGVSGTTDVLTFDLADSLAPPADNNRKAGRSVDGEVYICLDEARRRADQFSHDVRHELLLYAVHGLLHLLGYDDHDPREHRRMHEREDQLLEAVGVGRVFGRDPSTGEDLA